MIFSSLLLNNDKIMLFITKSQTETEMLGKNLAAKLKGGDILLLSGELGVGKTSLVKGIAKGLGIKHEITSPTFTLMNLYKLRTANSELRTLVHIDTYRLKDEKELLEIGVEDYLGESDTICIMEWPEKITSLLKKYKTTSIALEHGDKPEQRKISIKK
jgi:tRNA threonylcarbamoyladenosine biosynthesis protein TsaE